jgi:3-hydroxyisobutyrate dehydrogenase
MKGVHLVSAMEAMSLGKTVGLEPYQLYEIIKGAAGSSWMFADRTPQLLSGKWTSKVTVNDVIDSIVSLHLLSFSLSIKLTAFLRPQPSQKPMP